MIAYEQILSADEREIQLLAVEMARAEFEKLAELARETPRSVNPSVFERRAAMCKALFDKSLNSSMRFINVEEAR